jgi:hypothetical protein
LGDPVCSLSVSTYLLAALTCLVFIATFRAAIYARHAFEHERRVVIAAQPCRRKPAGAITRQALTNVEDHPEHRPDGGFLEVFLPTLADQFSTTLPEDFPLEISSQLDIPYDRRDFDILCAGRSPIINASIVLEVVNERAEYVVPLGSIAAGKQIHLVVWIADAVSRSLEFRWTPIAKHSDDNAVKFFPPQDLVVNPNYAVDLAAILPTQGPEQPPAKPLAHPPPHV